MIPVKIHNAHKERPSHGKTYNTNPDNRGKTYWLNPQHILYLEEFLHYEDEYIHPDKSNAWTKVVLVNNQTFYLGLTNDNFISRYIIK